MKKALAFLLCVIVMFLYSVPSFADDYIYPGEDTDIEMPQDYPLPDDGNIDMSELELYTFNTKDLEGFYKTGGRTLYNDGMPSLGYSCDSFEFNAYCQGDVMVTFSVPKINSSLGNGTYLTVYVDGVRQRRAVGHINIAEEETAVVATGLSLGNHNIKIVRSTELEPSFIYVKSITLAGEILEAPKNNDILIEFVGGAATAGQAMLYDKETALYDPAYAIYEDGTSSYAYKTATALSADISVVARQGIGVTTGWQKVSMIDVYLYNAHAYNSTALYDFKRQPKIIVVELGSCDYDVLRWNNTTKTKEEIDAGFSTMLNLLREKNPQSDIIWLYNFTDDYCNEIVPTTIKNMGGAEKGFYSLKITRNNAGGKGLPNEAGHTKAAEELTNFITENKLHLPKAPNVTITPKTNGVYNDPPTITLNKADEYTNKMYYKLYKSGETVPAQFTEYTSPITVTEVNEYVLVVAAANKSGSLGKEKTITFAYDPDFKNYMPGDISGDKTVDALDLIYLRKYLASWDIVVVEDACDTSGDGKTDVRDIVNLAKYLAGWSGIEVH